MFIVCVIIFMVDFACRFYKAVDGVRARAYFVFTRHTVRTIVHTGIVMKINFCPLLLAFLLLLSLMLLLMLLYLSTY